MGSAGSGKTTLASVLALLLDRSYAIVHGDAFFTASDSNIVQLSEILDSSRNWVFEHINAFQHSLDTGSPADFLVSISPAISTLRQRQIQRRDSITTSGYSEQSQVVTAQVEKARSMGIPILEGNGIEQLLPQLVRAMWQSDCLDRGFTTAVVKVASRCNLDCSYCYMYHMSDTDWRQLPVAISASAARQLGLRVAEYLKSSALPRFSIIFHGGEPLLLGPEGIANIAQEIVTGVGDYRERVSLGLQTNGTLLDDKMLDTLDRFGFSIGISIDSGTAEGNQERNYHSGRSAYPDILAGLRRALSYPWSNGRLSGVLAVVDPRSSGKATYEQFRQLGVKSVDFLIRDDTWDNPPSASSLEYLREALDEWLSDSEERRVRVFSTLIGGLFGVTSGTESFGLRPLSTLCVGTDGNYELLDVLRAAYPGAWKLPYSVFDTSINEVARCPEFSRIWEDKVGLAEECLACRYLFVCGGGYLPHRYSTTHRFHNTSVHCNDIKRFLEYAEAKVAASFSEAQSFARGMSE